MTIKKGLLASLGVAPSNAERYRPDLNVLLPEHNIDLPLRVAHFLAQVLHESSKMSRVRENLNYSAEGLRRVFSKYFTQQQANRYARQPEKIGSRVYGGRLGNGDEASGDGFRYRGRGLIQLTGKANYRRFSEWVGADVVAQPDLVASKYPVHSAVYYWETRNLNRLADSDDVKAVTRVVNGGFNGLPDRISLLDKARALFEVDAAPPALGPAATHIVSATSLNLRSRPRVSPSTWKASLPQGTEVIKIADSPTEGWAEVRLVLNGMIVDGVLAERFLEPLPAAPTPPPPAAIAAPKVHLTENRGDITRARDGGRAYPLGEPGRPNRGAVTSAAAKARKLVDIINYLDSENSDHKRYGPKQAATYCNIYAYDYCYLAGVYLPRVWWTDRALRTIREGGDPPVKYADTVRELNANSLHDWLADYGPEYGWKRVFDLDVLQSAANNGEVCLIVAQRNDLNSPGHIAAVVSEQAGPKAARAATGEILRPVESQAGVRNFRAVVKSKTWWNGERFRSFGFWRHA